MNTYIAKTVPASGFMVIEAETKDEAIAKVKEYMRLKGWCVNDYWLYVSLANKI